MERYNYRIFYVMPRGSRMGSFGKMTELEMKAEVEKIQKQGATIEKIEKDEQLV